MTNRARFLKIAGLGLGAGCGALIPGARMAVAAGGGPASLATTPGDALKLLVDGDARFTAGTPQNCGSQTEHMARLADGQNPFAAILGCSDSRVPNDTIFDQAPGNIFTVRVAGNFVNPEGLGSMEYGVAVLKAPLIVVLGHTGCGAVKAALAYVKDGTTQPGRIQDIVSAIAPAAKAAQGQPGDWLTNTIAANVKANVAAMTAQSAILRDAVTKGTLQVVGGVYDIATAKVTFFNQTG